MVALTEVVSFETRDEIGIIAIDNPPVNALGHPVRKGLADGIELALRDDRIKAVVIICRGRTFCAGADIREFGKPPIEPIQIDILPVIDTCPKPVVAAIHGTAFGGGLELALSCNYRVAVPDARFGMPESKLGLLPGAGGTQRLPRAVGVEKALEMIVFGNPITADESLELGLIDQIIEGDLYAGAVEFAKKVLSDNLPLKRVSQNDEKIMAARRQPELFEAMRNKIAKRFRGFQAPENCIKAVEAAVNLPFEDGLKRERELFTELMAGSQSAAQRYFFFAERAAAKIPDIQKNTPLLDIKSVGVIGAGTMGSGIAISFLDAAFPVTLVEREQQFLDKGLNTIQKHYQGQVKKGRISEEIAAGRIGLLQGSVSLSDLSETDLVIEAVFENMDLKKDIFRQLDGICKPAAILASNTSYLNINELAAETKRPEHILGLHFFSPANVMVLLEIVRGEKTSASVLATAMKIAGKIGKTAVMVGVCHGFVGNRIYLKRRQEVDMLLLEGVPLQKLDQVLYDFGFPMGPFVLNDLVGIDIGWDKNTTSGSTVKERLCEEGRFGLKTGKGYYQYEEGSRKPLPDPEVEKIIEAVAQKHGIQKREGITDEEIIKRCLYPMINEGIKILEEGIAVRPSDIDVIWVHGYGWPKYTGGPMFYADLVGLGNILETLKDFSLKFGDQFKPARLMEQLVEEGKSLKELN